MHCHSTSSVPRRCAQARVAVPTTRGCTLRVEWQCRPRGAARSGPSGSADHTATRRRAYRNGALRPEWQCRPHGTARSGPSGSADHTATRRRTYQDGALGPEWQCRPHGTARSGPSGSATHTATRRRAYGLHTLTLPLDVERTETVRPGPNGRATEAPVGGDCRPGGLPTTRVPRARGVRRGARGTCARQEPHRVWPGPARRPSRCERRAEIDEYVAQK